MSEYIDLDLTTDAVELYGDGLTAIEEQAPDGWTPSPLERWILSAVARMAVEVVIMAGQVPLRIFTYFGQNVLRIASLEATAATGSATFTLTDTAGHVVPADTQIDLDGVGFATLTALTVPAGQSSGTVAIQAVETGIAGSGLSGVADLVAPTLVFVDSIAVPPATSNGSDGETGEQYANRLADELPTLSPKVVLIDDVERRARRNPVVARAMAIDNYIPAGPGGTPAAQTTAEGAITVAVHDASGGDPGAPVRSAIAADLNENRIANLAISVIGPTETRVEIHFTAKAFPDADPAVVEAAAEQAVEDFISRPRWGQHGADVTEWTDTTVLSRNDLLWVVRDVEGVSRVLTLTLARFGDAQGTTDITLDGPAALPAANSVVDGTVTL